MATLMSCSQVFLQTDAFFSFQTGMLQNSARYIFVGFLMCVFFVPLLVAIEM